ncbi:MAG: substrate-binding domain-containing protein [Firmicutes bacterium]|nr:substrate-binding domain-containing protein [Bacillota bacterium]
MGIVKASEKKDAAAQFLEFLKSSEAAEKFESYGFTVL